MSEKRAPDSLNDVVDEIRKQLDTEEIALEKIFTIFSARIYGPMLLVPALLAVLPTGAIPGVPTLSGIILALVSMQLFIRVKHPWLPRYVKEFTISKNKLEKSLDYVETPVSKIEKYIKPRITVLTSKPWLNIIGLFGVTLGLSMAPLEILPFAVLVPGISALILAVGLTMRDGAWIIVGLSSALATYWLSYLALLEIIA